MPKDIFLEHYARLDPKQREGVDTLQGPAMVIAGPGTGKTTLLTLRIAQILRSTDTPPDSILALTFTESGVFSMRRKLVSLIGSAAYRVGIFTFHGFAQYLITRFKESFPRILGGRIATVSDQIRILEEIFRSSRFAPLEDSPRLAAGFGAGVRARNALPRASSLTGFTLIRPFGDIYFYVPRALRTIRDLKREGCTAALFAEALAQEKERLEKDPDRLHTTGRFRGELKASYRETLRRIEKSRELAVVYREYEKALTRERLYDFEDMILEVNAALKKDEDLLLTLEEQYQYILADEHQDANNAQSTMLELLASYDDSPNLFVVGDEKQAIYRFQGASIENFLYFKKLYPKAKLINLERNFRSTQPILDGAHSLMEKGSIPQDVPREFLRPRLKGRAGSGGIRFLEFSTAAMERAFVVSDIARRLAKGTPPSRIAVLFRNNDDAVSLVEALERTEIPFAVLSDEDILKDEELSKLLLLLRAVAEPDNQKLFAEALHLEFLGVPAILLYRYLRLCKEQRVSLFEGVLNRKVERRFSSEEFATLTKARAQFMRWADLARARFAGEVVETIARDSGFTAYLLKERGSLRALERLDLLFAHLKEVSLSKRQFKLSHFLETLDRLDRHGMRLGKKSLRPEFIDAVTLMTAHRAKGLEFDITYLIHAVDGHWGGQRTSADFYVPASLLFRLQKGVDSSDAHTEDERRLFYVSITRAREEVIITASRESDEGKPLLPSQFVEDIRPELVVREETAPLEQKLGREARDYLKPRVNLGPRVAFTEYLQKVFLEQGLTVTALNNFLSCPWEYFFKNLVRIPQLPEPYLMYGTAVHEALHDFFNAYRTRKVGKRDLLRFFTTSLEQSALPLREFRDFKERGKKALAGYFEHHRHSFARTTLNELEVTGVFVPLEIPRLGKTKTARGKISLLLRGKIDKLEVLPDGSVQVVDYKTGAPKTRGHILGETKSLHRASGDIKRQLDFYKLLLDRFERGRYRMRAGIIDFVEPDKKGRYHREIFEISEGETDTLLKEIARVGKEIYTFAFWDRRCGKRDCEYCTLRELLR